jgi:hypothetical protein
MIWAFLQHLSMAFNHEMGQSRMETKNDTVFLLSFFVMLAIRATQASLDKKEQLKHWYVSPVLV